MVKKPFPWIYIPTLYFAEGVPYVIVNTVSVIMYKKLGISNQLIGLTSVLYFPWVIKMFWGPIVDIYSTKRCWIIYTQLMMCLALVLVGIIVQLSYFFIISLCVFTIIAFTSATHDIATDGFYMLALDKKTQALYVGVRSTAYRLAMIFASGVLVIIAGMIEKNYGTISLSWTVVMIFGGMIFLVLFLFHRFY